MTDMDLQALQLRLDEMEKRNNGWHLNKSIPASFIVALVVQTVLFAAYMGRLDERVESIENKTAELDHTNRRQYDLISVEREKSQKVSVALGRLEGKLDILIEVIEKNSRK